MHFCCSSGMARAVRAIVDVEKTMESGKAADLAEDEDLRRAYLGR